MSKQSYKTWQFQKMSTILATTDYYKQWLPGPHGT